MHCTGAQSICMEEEQQASLYDRLLPSVPGIRSSVAARPSSTTSQNFRPSWSAAELGAGASAGALPPRRHADMSPSRCVGGTWSYAPEASVSKARLRSIGPVASGCRFTVIQRASACTLGRSARAWLAGRSGHHTETDVMQVHVAACVPGFGTLQLGLSQFRASRVAHATHRCCAPHCFTLFGQT